MGVKEVGVGTGDKTVIIAAGGYVDNIRDSIDLLAEISSLCHFTAAFAALGAADTNLDDEIIAHLVTNGLYQLHREAAAVIQRTAVFVLPVVGHGRKELRGQPAVGRMNHDTVSAYLFEVVGSLGKVIADPHNIVLRHCTDFHTVFGGVSIRANGIGISGAVGSGGTAMSKLDHDQIVPGDLGSLNDPLPSLKLGAGKLIEIRGENVGAALGVRFIYRGFTNGHRCKSAHGALLQMLKLTGTESAIFLNMSFRAIGSRSNSVFEGFSPYGQRT